VREVKSKFLEISQDGPIAPLMPRIVNRLFDVGLRFVINDPTASAKIFRKCFGFDEKLFAATQAQCVICVPDKRPLFGLHLIGRCIPSERSKKGIDELLADGSFFHLLPLAGRMRVVGIYQVLNGILIHIYGFLNAHIRSYAKSTVSAHQTIVTGTTASVKITRLSKPHLPAF
jgi:hypothetical protein